MKALLLYHIYPINHWRAITEKLLAKRPFHRIIVHASLPENEKNIEAELQSFFKEFGIHALYTTPNSGHGEVDALKRLLQEEDLKGYDILTYMHCKGVTKPDNKFVQDWTEALRFFTVEKINWCKRAFKKGYVTYGINKTINERKNEPGFKGSNFFYEGNFVSLNLHKVKLRQAVADHLEDHYYGLEGFWGKLCTSDKAYSPFNSGLNHYMSPLKPLQYNNPFGRLKYRLLKAYHTKP